MLPTITWGGGGPHWEATEAGSIFYNLELSLVFVVEPEPKPAKKFHGASL
jgi:hypothetical protein